MTRSTRSSPPRAARRPRFVALLAICVAALGACSAPAPALAGSYTVTGCPTGWVPQGRDTSANANGPSTFENCSATVPALFASVGLNQRVNPGDFAAWRFVAPPCEVIITPLSCRRADATAIPSITFFLSILRSTVTLVDRSAPVVSQAGGDPVGERVWSGALPLTFAASDTGSGVYRALVDVDGAIVKALPVATDGRCVDHTGARDFAFAVPCPLQAGGTVDLAAASLPAGPHVVAVYLEDAAGNRAALMPPRRKLIVNDLAAAGYFAGGRFFNPALARPRVTNGAGAVSGARHSAAFVRTVGKRRHRRRRVSTARVVRFGERPTVRGTLKGTAGRPIARATVFIAQRREGGQWRLDGTVRTDAKGRFTYRAAARQADRRLRAVYFPFSDSHENAQSAVLNLGVRAGMALHVTPHRARNGQTVTFSGRVFGRLPAAGIAAALQAKVGRGYRTFRQLRARPRALSHRLPLRAHDRPRPLPLPADGRPPGRTAVPDGDVERRQGQRPPVTPGPRLARRPDRQAMGQTRTR